jgi:hypothetical protein
MAIATQDSTTTKANLTEARLNTLVTRLVASGGVTIGHASADNDSDVAQDNDSDVAQDGDSDMGSSPSSYSQADQQSQSSRINNLKNNSVNPMASRVNNLKNNSVNPMASRVNNQKTAYNDLVTRFNNLVDALAATGIING